MAVPISTSDCLNLHFMNVIRQFFGSEITNIFEYTRVYLFMNDSNNETRGLSRFVFKEGVKNKSSEKGKKSMTLSQRNYFLKSLLNWKS